MRSPTAHASLGLRANTANKLPLDRGAGASLRHCTPSQCSISCRPPPPWPTAHTSRAPDADTDGRLDPRGIGVATTRQCRPFQRSMNAPCCPPSWPVKYSPTAHAWRGETTATESNRSYRRAWGSALGVVRQAQVSGDANETACPALEAILALADSAVAPSPTARTDISHALRLLGCLELRRTATDTCRLRDRVRRGMDRQSHAGEAPWVSPVANVDAEEGTRRGASGND